MLELAVLVKLVNWAPQVKQVKYLLPQVKQVKYVLELAHLTEELHAHHRKEVFVFRDAFKHVHFAPLSASVLVRVFLVKQVK
jgi:hypothetical protein